MVWRIIMGLLVVVISKFSRDDTQIQANEFLVSSLVPLMLEIIVIGIILVIRKSQELIQKSYNQFVFVSLSLKSRSKI